LRKCAAILATAVAVFGCYTASATGARKPTQGERFAITQATIAAMEAAQNRAVPSFTGAVNSITVSTVTTPTGYFTRYAVAGLYDPAIGAAAVFLGFRRGYWNVLDFGSSDVGCSFPQNYLGGGRFDILRDLHLTCH